MLAEGLRGQAQDVLPSVVLDQVEVLEGGDRILLPYAGLLTYFTGGGEEEEEEEEEEKEEMVVGKTQWENLSRLLSDKSNPSQSHESYFATETDPGSLLTQHTPQHTSTPISAAH